MACRAMRFSKTDNALMEAMFQLLELRDLESITVNELCIEASISRTAFYAHVEDKYDLALRCIEKIVKDIPAQNCPTINEGILTMLDAIFARRKALRNLCKFHASKELERKCSQMLTEFYSECYLKEFGGSQALSVPATIAAIYHGGGMLKLLKWWLENDCAEKKENVADYILQLHDRSLRAISR